jgi:hypothetical protein
MSFEVNSQTFNHKETGMETSMDLIEKFDAKGATGTAYHVEVYQTPIERSDAPLPGAKTYRLDDGRALNPHSEDKLRIVQTGEKIYRI